MQMSVEGLLKTKVSPHIERYLAAHPTKEADFLMEFGKYQTAQVIADKAYDIQAKRKQTGVDFVTKRQTLVNGADPAIRQKFQDANQAYANYHKAAKAMGGTPKTYAEWEKTATGHTGTRKAYETALKAAEGDATLKSQRKRLSGYQRDMDLRLAGERDKLAQEQWEYLKDERLGDLQATREERADLVNDGIRAAIAGRHTDAEEAQEKARAKRGEIIHLEALARREERAAARDQSHRTGEQLKQFQESQALIESLQNTMSDRVTEAGWNPISRISAEYQNFFDKRQIDKITSEAQGLLAKLPVDEIEKYSSTVDRLSEMYPYATSEQLTSLAGNYGIPSAIALFFIAKKAWKGFFPAQNYYANTSQMAMNS